MPELPEVETMRRGVARVAGSHIACVSFPRPRGVRPCQVHPSRPAFRRRARGEVIRAVGRLGKRLVLELGGGDRIVFEPRMTGLALLADPPSTRHLRARLLLEGGRRGSPPELLFWDRRGLGTLSLLSPAELRDRLGPDQLGPDALDLPPGSLRERLGASRRAVKVALLDQRAVAGIGNIYAAECLHGARVLPTRRCDDLRPREWRALEAALQEILKEAIRYEGSTLGDGTYRNALNREGGYQSHHRVYGREGQPCRRCRGSVRRTVLGQRATFFCPRCQR